MNQFPGGQRKAFYCAVLLLLCVNVGEVARGASPTPVASAPLNNVTGGDAPLPGSTQSPTATPPRVENPNNITLEYQRFLGEQTKEYQTFLRTETDRHQAFLQSWFTIVTWVLGIAAAIFIGIIGWTNWKALRDVKKEVKSQFGALVRSNIDRELDIFRQHIEASKTRVENQVTELQNKVAAEKADTDQELEVIAEYASIVGHAAVVLSLKPSTDPKENELQNRRRREILGRLRGLQQRVPTHRTLAIFISRLYRALDDLPKAVQFLDDAIRQRAI
jgi:hypothetical protein